MWSLLVLQLLHQLGKSLTLAGLHRFLRKLSLQEKVLCWKKFVPSCGRSYPGDLLGSRCLLSLGWSSRALSFSSVAACSHGGLLQGPRHCLTAPALLGMFIFKTERSLFLSFFRPRHAWDTAEPPVLLFFPDEDTANRPSWLVLYTQHQGFLRPRCAGANSPPFGNQLGIDNQVNTEIIYKATVNGDQQQETKDMGDCAFLAFCPRSAVKLKAPKCAEETPGA